MAYTSAAVITPGTGFVFVATSGTVIPTPAEVAAYVPGGEITTVGGTWKSVGHTSRDDLPQFGYDGGDTSVQGTWQNASFREVVTEAPADFLTFNALQVDSQVLSMYYGQALTATSGVVNVPNSPTGTLEQALLVIIVDGPRRVYFHASGVSIRREGAIEPSVDSFMQFPIRATFLKISTNPIYSWGGVAAVV